MYAAHTRYGFIFSSCALIRLTFWQVRDAAASSTGSVRARLILDRGYFCRCGSRWLAAALWPRARSPPRPRIGAREPERRAQIILYRSTPHHHSSYILFKPEEYTSHYIIIFFFSFCPAPDPLHESYESSESIEDLYTTASSKCFINISIQLFFFSSIQTTRHATGKNYMITYIARILLVRTGDNRLFAIVRAGFRL